MGEPLRVLIVEDVADDAELLLHELRRYGYSPEALRVETAESMADALARATWDVVLSDNSLPHFNALGALSVLHERGLDIPFLVISGSIGEDAAIALMKAGADDYLFKGSLARLGVAVSRELREAATRRERRALNERLEMIAKASSDVVYDHDIRAGSVWWNDNLFTAFRHAATDAVADIAWYFGHIHEEDLPGVIQSFEAALAGDADTWTCEYRFRRGDGSYASVLDRSSIVRDGNGDAVRAVGAMLDITERKLLEQQLLQAQKMEAIGRLAGGVAHDFNNVLTVIGGLSYVILDELDPSAPLRAEVEEVQLAAERGATLTRQLLAFSRKQVLQPAVLDLNTVVSNLEPMLRRLVGEDVEIATRLAAGAGLVKADRGQLEQVLMNLVVNARDAMPRGGRITVETAVIDMSGTAPARLHRIGPGPFVALAVRDTGTGIDPAVLERLFEPFFTTKEQGKGTGLGLATTYGIVDQSGGHIDVRSQPGAGSTFTVYLPIAQEAGNTPASERVVTDPVTGWETILVVEDDAAVRGVTERILRAGGYEVVCAADGFEALARAADFAGRVHLVLSDIVMPRMSGPELVERLRTDGDPRVIFTSGHSPESSLFPMTQGDWHFIQKPFTPGALLGKVRAVLNANGTSAPPR